MVVMDDGGGWAEEGCISCWGGAASWDVDAGIHVGRCGRPCSPIMRRTASLNSSRLLWVPTIFPPPPLVWGRRRCVDSLTIKIHLSSLWPPRAWSSVLTLTFFINHHILTSQSRLFSNPQSPPRWLLIGWFMVHQPSDVQSGKVPVSVTRKRRSIEGSVLRSWLSDIDLPPN